MRRCQWVCKQPADRTLVVAHPTTGPVFTDRCPDHRSSANHPIVDVLPLGTNLALVPRSLEDRRPWWRRWLGL